GTSEQMQWQTVNGQQSVRMVESHVYLLRPKKKGALAITPATVKVGGQTLQTKAITIHVAPVPKNALSTVAPPQQGRLPMIDPAPGELRGEEDLFVDANTDKAKV